MKRQPDPWWSAFVKRHPGNRFLEQDPIYALSEDAIEAIDRRIPGFFGDNLGFERDLAHSIGQGFFLQRPIGDVPDPQTVEEIWKLPGMTIGSFIQQVDLIHFSANPRLRSVRKRLAPPLGWTWSEASRWRSVLNSISDFGDELLCAKGRPEFIISAARRQEENESSTIERRQEAYVGWLVTDLTFQAEIRLLRHRWDKTIQRMGRIPGMATDQEKLGSASRKEEACTKAIRVFCRRWGFEKLLTWDLPLPSLPAWHVGGLDDWSSTLEEGVTVSLPWYLLRGEKLDLQEVIRRLRTQRSPEHLSPWLLKSQSERDDTSGEISYQRLFWLYRCYELVLKRRYSASCARNMEKLDRAMAEVIERDPELVRKLRQRLLRSRRTKTR